MEWKLKKTNGWDYSVYLLLGKAKDLGMSAAFTDEMEVVMSSVGLTCQVYFT